MRWSWWRIWPAPTTETLLIVRCWTAAFAGGFFLAMERKPPVWARPLSGRCAAGLFAGMEVINGIGMVARIVTQCTEITVESGLNKTTRDGPETNHERARWRGGDVPVRR